MLRVPVAVPASPLAVLLKPVAVLEGPVALLDAPVAVVSGPEAVLAAPKADPEPPLAVLFTPHSVLPEPEPVLHGGVPSACAGLGYSIAPASTSGVAVASSFETKVLCMMLSYGSGVAAPPLSWTVDGGLAESRARPAERSASVPDRQGKARL